MAKKRKGTRPNKVRKEENVLNNPLLVTVEPKEYNTIRKPYK